MQEIHDNLRNVQQTTDLQIQNELKLLEDEASAKR